MPQNNSIYFSRVIDLHLLSWKADVHHKPLLLRGARQVGKSSAVRHLGETFEIFLEVNLIPGAVVGVGFQYALTAMPMKRAMTDAPIR